MLIFTETQNGFFPTYFIFNDASYFDRINMTKNGLEYDRKKFAPTNVKVGT